MSPTAGSGMLFEDKARSAFKATTLRKYHAMVARLKKKKLPPVRFTLQEFRMFTLRLLGGYDGVLACQYCKKRCTLEETAADHMVALSRGGSTDLDNIDFPCGLCNFQKGSLNPEEFHALLAFLEREIPFGRTNVLSRLAKADKLAAGARRNAVLLRDRKARAPQPQQPVIEESF